MNLISMGLLHGKRAFLALGVPLLLISLAIFVPAAAAQSNDPQVNRNLEQANQEYQRRQKEAAKQRSLRANPPPHQGRLKVSPDTSLGGNVGGGGAEVNVRKSFD